MSDKKVIVAIFALLVIGVLFVVQKMSREKAQVAPNENSLVSSVEEAFVSGMSVSCYYKDDTGTVEIFIKDGALRFDDTIPSDDIGVQHFIHRLDVTHMWRGSKGLTFRDISKRRYEEASPYFISTNQALQYLEKYNDYCEIKRIDDTVFDQPEGIGFTSIRTNEEAAQLEEGAM